MAALAAVKDRCYLCGTTRGILRPTGPRGLACMGCRPDAVARPLPHRSHTDSAIPSAPYGDALAPSTLADGTSSDPLMATHLPGESGPVMSDTSESDIQTVVDAVLARHDGRARKHGAASYALSLSDDARVTFARALAVKLAVSRRAAWGLSAGMLSDVDAYASDALSDWYTDYLTNGEPLPMGQYVLRALDAARKRGGTGARSSSVDVRSITDDELAGMGGAFGIRDLRMAESDIEDAAETDLFAVPGRWIVTATGRTYVEPERIPWYRVCTADLEGDPAALAAYAVILAAKRAERTAASAVTARGTARKTAGRGAGGGRAASADLSAIIGQLLATVATETERATAYAAATGRKAGGWRVAKLRYLRAGGRPAAAIVGAAVACPVTRSRPA